MPRATSPWRRLTALAPPAAAQRQRVMPDGCAGIGRVDAAQRQEAFAVAAGIGHAAEHRQHLVARIGLVAGGDRRVRREHDLLAHLLPGRVVAHVGPAARAPAPAARTRPAPDGLRSGERRPARCPAPAVRASPPMPSTAYCARRMARLLSYRRDVTQRPTALFCGRSVSSRYSGTRPTSTRQTWTARSSSSTGTVTVSGWPVGVPSPARRAAARGRRRASTRAACR